MQESLICEELPEVMDNKIIEITLNRLEKDQKAIVARLDSAYDKINNIGRDLVRIETALQPRDLPWAVRFILLPLAVATTIAVVGAVVHLEITVIGMGRDITKQSLIAHAALPQDDFKATLPDFATSMSKAKEQGINLSPTVINDLQSKLVATDTSAPAFWTAATAFISYHYCPAKFSGSQSNSLKIRPITHSRSRNDLNWKGTGLTSFRRSPG